MRIQCRIHGIYKGIGMPMFVREAAIGHALELLAVYQEETPLCSEPLRKIDFGAGDGVICDSLIARMDRGTWNFHSAASSRIAQSRYQVAAKIPLPALFLQLLSRTGPGRSVRRNIWTRDGQVSRRPACER